MSQFLLVCALFISSASVWAGDLEWSGLYRFEATSIDNGKLETGSKRKKEYATHHLILRPKIVAADGIYINAQIHLLNSDAGGPQLGSLWGEGVGADAAYPYATNTSSDSEELNEIYVSQTYLTWQQEFGALIVGRAPIQFGLGITYNAGLGFFDHYLETRDLVGYKVVMGNFFILPMIAKINEGAVGGYDDVSETLVQLQYENFETDVAMGFMYRNRRAGPGGNDVLVSDGAIFGDDSAYGNGAGAGAPAVVGDFNVKDMNIFYRRQWEKDRVGFEISNRTGEYGVTNAAGDKIDASGYLVAFEYARKSPSSRWSYDFKAGWATGDNPTTETEYEGYAFDQNYDLGILMFNHGLGQANLLRTEILGTRYPAAGHITSVNDVDIESISNVYYLAPSATYQWRDKWLLKTTLVTGWLEQTEYSIGGTDYDADQNLGYELNLSLVFKPHERLIWENTFAYMMTGDAFRVDNLYGVSDGFGLVSRAAISF